MQAPFIMSRHIVDEEKAMQSMELLRVNKKAAMITTPVEKLRQKEAS